MQIDCDFPGGNIVVEHVGKDEVRLHQDLRDTAGDWFYWYFRVRGAAGRTVRFQFTRSACIGARGAAISRDAGRTWQWQGGTAASAAPDAAEADSNAFSHTFDPQENDVRFAMGFPYVEANWQAFTSRHAQQMPAIGSLCHTRSGLPVPLLHLPATRDQARHTVVVTCRHHCCEAMASYTLEGLVAFLLSNSAAAQGLRERTAFAIIPFVDKDGVQAGDQGKNRRPHDHNRDYNAGLYPETVAIRNWITDAVRQGQTLFVIDLHCPWLRNGSNETVYMVGSPEPKIAAQQEHFCRILEAVREGPLPFYAADRIAWGQEWNTEANRANGLSFAAWATQAVPAARLITTLEVPYANAHGVEVTDHSARALGEDIGRALAQFAS